MHYELVMLFYNPVNTPCLGFDEPVVIVIEFVRWFARIHRYWSHYRKTEYP